MPATPYIGNVIIFAGNYAPYGWAFCNGQLLNIGDYDALYSLIGTTYGGDGQTTFGLPDLRGRTPIHFGNGTGPNFVLGELGGTESVTLTADQLPAHTHYFGSGQAATSGTPDTPPATSSNPVYTNTVAGKMAPDSIGNFVGNGAHENRQPLLALNYIIALEGIYPPRG